MRFLPYLIHLRLLFQFLLSPVFLWGYLVAGGRVNATLGLAYVAFHFFGYAGGTALNSHYDRDEGPIGGLAHPPPVPPHLLAFSLAWQGIGFIIAVAVGPAVAGIYLAMFLLSVAYSHPRLRWKGNPLLSLFTVALGQGVLAFVAGWTTARGDPISVLQPFAILAALAATLMITGFYPVTGSYQIGADRARGDHTLASSLGVRGAFRFAEVGLVVGGLAAVIVAASLYSLLEGALLGSFLLLLLVWIHHWSENFDHRSVLQNFRTTMQTYAALTLPFLGWIAYRLVFH